MIPWWTLLPALLAALFVGYVFGRAKGVEDSMYNIGAIIGMLGAIKHQLNRIEHDD